MSRPVTIQWPVASTTAVCLSQALGAAGSLVINGTLSFAGVATFPNIERIVTLTSAGNDSGVNFTITGTLQGSVVSETIAGPNANTVSTTQKFTTVTSVTVNGALVANASVGTGLTGSTVWIQSDYYRTNNALAVAVIVTAAVTYTFETTFDDVHSVASPVVLEPIDGVTVPVIPAASDMTGATTTVLANYTIPTNFSRIRISASDATGAATVYFLQQGIS